MVRGMTRFAPVLTVSAMLLAACQPGAEDDATIPGNTSDTAPFALIGAEETVRFAGTEPFWGGSATGGTLTYTTPEDIDGTAISVSRFAGRGGLSFSGELQGAKFDLLITQGRCSDGMSDRTYPFVATLSLGGEVRNGCAWTASRPFTGGEGA